MCRLEFGNRPKRSGKSEAGDNVIRGSASKRRFNFLQAVRYVGLAAATNQEPKRLAILVQRSFDVFHGSVGSAFSRAQWIRSRVHMRKPRDQNRAGKKKESGRGEEDGKGFADRHGSK